MYFSIFAAMISASCRAFSSEVSEFCDSIAALFLRFRKILLLLRHREILLSTMALMARIVGVVMGWGLPPFGGVGGELVGGGYTSALVGVGCSSTAAYDII